MNIPQTLDVIFQKGVTNHVGIGTVVENYNNYVHATNLVY